MKELSAGGIIVYRTAAGWDVLVMKDMKGNWTFPKGKIEADEELLTTAKREIEEEVGLTGLVLVSELAPVSYFYYRGGSIRKTVHYYLFRSKTRQQPTVQTEEGITEAKWVSLRQAGRMIGYPKTNAPLLTEAARILRKSKAAADKRKRA